MGQDERERVFMECATRTSNYKHRFKLVVGPEAWKYDPIQGPDKPPAADRPLPGRGRGTWADSLFETNNCSYNVVADSETI